MEESKLFAAKASMEWYNVPQQQSVLFQDETGVDAAASGRRDNPQRGRKIHRITSGTLEALVRYPYPLPTSS